MDTEKIVQPEVQGNFLIDHPILTIVAILCAILAIFLIIRIFFALRARRKKTVEVASLKQDLMIWSRLSSLVHGGKKTDKAKLELNNKLLTIDSLFNDAKSIIKEFKYLGQDHRWFIMLGEPSCGKSTCLQNSNNEFKVSIKEGKIKPPVKFYINYNTVFVDVSGKAFFDNWLGGSSAEWSYICEKIRKANHRKPLDAIVLNISAESLIADDKELTRKKANLMVSELLRLTTTLRMMLPVYVNITKLDVISGFREYFAGLDDQGIRQPVGYQPTVMDGFFNPDDFEAFFVRFVKRLRDGAVGQMQRADVADLIMQNESRSQITANMYIFPGALNEIKDNLLLYLEVIFGNEALRGKPALVFSGLYFSSAEDKGYCLSRRFASMQNMSVDDAPLSASTNVNSRPYFISSFISKIVGVSQNAAQFTKRELFIRRIPRYACYACLGILSIVYWYGSLVKAPELEKRLQDDTYFYRDLAKQFDNGNINASRLFSVDYSGNGVKLFDAPIPQDSSTSRINFFTQVQARLSRKKDIPLYFFPHGMVNFGLELDTDLPDCYFVYDQIQSRMAFLPLLESTEYNMKLTGDEPFSEEKTNALIALANISLYDAQSTSVFRNTVYDQSTMKSMIDYMYPKVPDSIKRQLEYFLPDYDFSAASTNTAIILRPEYTESCREGINGLVSNWGSLLNYPEHQYSIMKISVNAAKAMLKTYDDLLEMAQMNSQAKTPIELSNYIRKYNSLVAQYKTKTPYVDEMSKFASVAMDSMTDKLMSKATEMAGVEDENLKKIISNPYFMQFEAAYRGYVGLLDRDFSFFDYYDKQAASIKNASYDSLHGIHFGGLNFRQFIQDKKEIASKLSKEHDSLKEGLISVSQSELFATGEDQHSINDMPYNVVKQILSNSVLDIDKKSSLATMEEIAEYAEVLDNVYKYKMGLLEKFTSRNKSTQEIVKKWVEIGKEMLTMAYLSAKIDVTNRVVEIYPDDDTDLKMMSSIAVLIGNVKYDPRDVEGVNLDLTKDVLGHFSLRDEYNPEGFSEYIEPVVQIKKILDSEDENFQYFKEVFSKSEKLLRLIRVMGRYSVNYMNYWGSLPDTFHPVADSYSQFYDLASTVKSYQINDELQKFYSLSYDLIDAIDPCILAESDVAKRKAMLDRLKQRSNNIDINFIDACSDVLSAWSLLSPDATYANKQVMEMTDKEIKSQLMTLGQDKKSKSYVPWWSSFTDLGVKLLKRDASKEASLSLMQFQSELKFFPIIKDADPHRRVVSKNQLKSLLVLFKSFGLGDTAPEAATDPLEAFAKDSEDKLSAKNDLHASLVFSRNSNKQGEFKAWASNVSRMLTLLSGSDKSLQFKLGVVDAADQSRLMTAQNLGSELAIARYRYFDITVGDGKTSQRVPSFINTVQGQGRAITTSPVNNDEIVMRFYRFSDSVEPDCQLVIDGSYPAFQLYLDEMAEYNEEVKACYVPVELTGKNGEKSIFFISVGFIGNIPTPDQWPSSDDWPSADSFASL